MTHRDEDTTDDHALSRDNSDLSELYKQYGRPLLGYLRGFDVSYQDAEDIAQIVWLEVSERMDRPPAEGGFDPGIGGFYTWITRCVAWSKVLDWKRKERKRRKRTLTISGEQEQQIKDTRPTFDEAKLYQMHMVFCELFRLLFLCGGYPHEQLAYGFAKLIYGKPSHRSIEARAANVDTDYGDKELQTVVGCFMSKYSASSGLIGVHGFLRVSLRHLHCRMEYKVEELIRNLAKELKRIQNTVIADTCFRDYYIKVSDRDTHPTSDWFYRVEEKLRRILGIEKGVGLDKGVEQVDWSAQRDPGKMHVCGRCKLRTVEPCITKMRKHNQID
jgi:DNA-directed RNA polymerase specialized sigma24 family protein